MRYPHSMIFMTLTISILFLTTARAQNAEDWPKYRRDPSNSGHSAETGTLANGVTTVDSTNIGTLALKWKQALGGPISGSPAIVGGFVYIGTWNGVFYKLDATTGRILAKKSLVPSAECSLIKDVCRIAGSPMVANGMVYIGASKVRSPTSIAATLYALNSSNLSIAWSASVTPQLGAEIWSSPVVSNGLVYFGVASHNDKPCIEGRVYAVSTSTHFVQWKFKTLDQTSCPAGTTCKGAGVWTSAAVDAAHGIVYFGTGNPGFTCTPSTPNATRYPDSVVALNATTGALLSQFAAASNDTNDFDFGSSPVLTTTGSQSWVAEASKNGLMYFLPTGPTGILGSPSTIAVGSDPIASPAVLSGSANNLYQPTASGTLVNITQSSTGGLSTNQVSVSSAKIFSAPLIVNDVVLFGSEDFKLYAASTSGGLLFSFPTKGQINSGPAESNGRIYFGSNDGNLYALSVGAK